MFRIVSKTVQSETSAAAFKTVTLPTHSTGDLLYIWIFQDVGGTAITQRAGTTGWTVTNPTTVSNGARAAFAWKIVSSAPETNPAFDGANDEWQFVTLVIRGAHATTPIGSTNGTDHVNSNWSGSSNALGSGLTTAYDGMLLLCGWVIDNGIAGRIKLSDAIGVTKTRDTTLTGVTGYRQQETAGVAPTFTMYAKDGTEGGNGWVVAVRSATSTDRVQDCRVSIDEDQWFGDFGATHNAVTWTKPDDFAATINSISVSSNSPTTTTTATNSLWPLGTLTSLSNSASDTATSIVGATYSHAAKDLTGKTMYLQWASGAGSSSARVGADGVLVGFSDGTYWVTYQLASKSFGFSTDFLTSALIEIGNAVEYFNSEGTSSSSIDWSAITRRFFGWHRTAGGSAAVDSLRIRNQFFIETASITGGSSDFPADLPTAQENLVSWDAFGLADLQGDYQVLGKFPIYCGDGTNRTYIDTSGQALGFPVAYSITSVSRWQMAWNSNANQAGLYIKAGANDTLKIDAAGISTVLSQPMSVDASSNTGASVSVYGSSIVGLTYTDNAGHNISNGTFKNGGTVSLKESATGLSVSDTVGAVPAVSMSVTGKTLTDCVIDVTGTSATYHLEVGNGGTGNFAITLADQTLTGTPATDKVHVTNTSGTTTITISGTTTLVAGDVTTAGATVVISGPTVNQVVIVSGQTAGSRIQIYDTTNSIELFNGTASAGNTVVSGTVATWTDPTAAAGNRAIRVRVAYVSGATAKGFLELTGLTCGTTAGTASITYPVTQVADTTYDDNAITGSGVTGVTFTDSSPDVVNIDVASNSITWPSIYAAWVYYAFTSTGIATDIDYIDGIDTANYILSNMKVKNTSSPSDPLVVSGGYGRDFTTGASVDLVDTTGGTLIFAPDHVVSYATGSGVTSQDKIDIAAEVLSQASSAPIAANIKKVADTTVTGSGTEVSPWGP